MLIDRDEVIKAIKQYGKAAINEGRKSLDAVDDIVKLIRIIRMVPVKKPQTNAGRIRAMNDEELAKLLIDADKGNLLQIFCDEKYCKLTACPHDCTSATLKWLQQPAEEAGKEKENRD